MSYRGRGRSQGIRGEYRGGSSGDHHGASRSDYHGSSRSEYRGSSRGDFRGSSRGDFRGSSRGGDFRGSSRGGDFRGSSRGVDFRGSSRGGDFRGSSRGGDFRGSSRGGDFRGSSRGGDFRGSSRGGDFRGSSRGDFRGGSRGDYHGVSHDEYGGGSHGRSRSPPIHSKGFQEVSSSINFREHSPNRDSFRESALSGIFTSDLRNTLKYDGSNKETSYREIKDSRPSRIDDRLLEPRERFREASFESQVRPNNFREPGHFGSISRDNYSGNDEYSSSYKDPISSGFHGSGRGESRYETPRDEPRRSMQSSSDDLLSALGSDAKIALTKALVASVLKDEKPTFEPRHEPRVHRERRNFEFHHEEVVHDRSYSNEEIHVERRPPRGRGRGRASFPRGGVYSEKRHLEMSVRKSRWDDHPSAYKRQRLSDEAEHYHSDTEHYQSDTENHTGDQPGVETPSFVKLICPHCPHMHTLRFRTYKMHLSSPEHSGIVKGLGRKHNAVMYCMRTKQRDEKKKEENEWQSEDPKGYERFPNQFCALCKFSYKCKLNNAGSIHEKTKYHMMQKRYSHPKCEICRKMYPSRLAYDIHRASITHLKNKAAREKDNVTETDKKVKDEVDYDSDIDPENFLTLDSVDHDPDGTEDMDLEAQLAAVGIEEDKEDDDDDEDNDGNNAEADLNSSKNRRGWKRGRDGEETDDEQDDDQDDNIKPLGVDYVQLIEAFFCELCEEVVRGDCPEGSNYALTQHCKSECHLNLFKVLHPDDDDEEEEENKRNDVKTNGEQQNDIKTEELVEEANIKSAKSDVKTPKKAVLLKRITKVIVKSNNPAAAK